jgi:hypothetical protein
MALRTTANDPTEMSKGTISTNSAHARNVGYPPESDRNCDLLGSR